MASDYYLLIDKINGESQAQGMAKNIELDSFSFGASNPADVGGGGLSAGKCSLSDFSFSCALDSSSFQMLTDLYAGTHIATCTFTGRKSGGGGNPYNYLVVTLTNCYITSQSTGGGSTGMRPICAARIARRRSSAWSMSHPMRPARPKRRWPR